MKMKHFNILLAVILAICSISCSSYQMMADYDKEVDFSSFNTCQFIGWENNSDESISSFDKIRIEDAFRKEFEKRGLQVVDSGADLQISLDISTQERSYLTSKNFNTSPYGFYYGYGPRWGFHYSEAYIEEVQVEEGILVCSVYNSDKDQLVWQCTANERIDRNPSNNDYFIPRFVSFMMRKYPSH